MKKTNYTQGFTLIELMIVVAIIGIVASIAVPAYENYIRTSEYTVAKQNAVALAAFEDLYFYENDTYLAGTYVPNGADTLTTALDWKPSGDQDQFEYVVTPGTCPDGLAKCYTITVTLISDPTIYQTLSRP